MTTSSGDNVLCLAHQLVNSSVVSFTKTTVVIAAISAVVTTRCYCEFVISQTALYCMACVVDCRSSATSALSSATGADQSAVISILHERPVQVLVCYTSLFMTDRERL